MRRFVRQQAQLLALRMDPVPSWLTHMGALGLFFIAVVNSSVIPLPLPGSIDLVVL